MIGVDIASIVQGAYDAALQDNLWEPWSHDLMRKLGGSGGFFTILNRKERRQERPITLLGSARAVEEYFAGQYQHDPQVEIACSWPGLGIYKGFPGIDLTNRHTADYLRWQENTAKIVHTQTAIMPLGDGALRAGISIHRSASLGPVERDHHRALQSLLPELSRAMQLGFQLGEQLQEAFWNGLSIGRKNQIAFLLDEHGNVIRHTDAAGQFISQADGLDIKSGTLCGVNPGDRSSIEAIVKRAVQSIAPRSGAARVSRRSRRRPLIIVCYPLQRTARTLAPLEAAALAVVLDPNHSPAQPVQLYQEAFRLTPREASMAAKLMNGHSVESAAAAMSISLPTARSHLRAIFEKTGAIGQSDLIRLLSRLG